MRCFIGIPLAEDVRGELAKLGKRLCNSKTRMKLVEPENLHVTVKFLGELGEEQLGEAKEQLKQIDASAFEARLTHLGAFPSSSYVRVLWAGFGEGKEKLKSIHDQIAHEKDYEPHVTMARLKSRPDEAVTRLLGEKLDLPMRAESVQLMESVLGPQGPKYSKVTEVELD